jgi:uncharacterized protein (TIGR00369 family)
VKGEGTGGPKGHSGSPFLSPSFQRIASALVPLDPEFESAIRSRFATSDFARWMGMRLVALDEGTSEIALDLQPHHLNPGGIVHGGIIATALDAAIGLALRTTIGAQGHVTVQLGIQYLSPAKQGTLIARGRRVHTGARTGYGEAEISTKEGHLLAKGSATFLVVRAAPVPAGD